LVSPRSGFLLFALLAAGCSDDDDGPPPPPACTLPFLGDAAEPVVIEPVQLDAARELVPLEDGDDIALILPPQGGRVIFAGVRAQNVDPCAAKLQGVLRDLEGNMPLQLDTRIVNLKVEGEWGSSNPADISSFSNVPVCPNNWSNRDANGLPYELTVTLTDRGGRKAETTLEVTPVCAEPEHQAECECICAEGYVLGESCSGGGGGA
jgi:hypothetical protein